MEGRPTLVPNTFQRTTMKPASSLSGLVRRTLTSRGPRRDAWTSSSSRQKGLGLEAPPCWTLGPPGQMASRPNARPSGAAAHGVNRWSMELPRLRLAIWLCHVSDPCDSTCELQSSLSLSFPIVTP